MEPNKEQKRKGKGKGVIENLNAVEHKGKLPAGEMKQDRGRSHRWMTGTTLTIRLYC